MKKVAFVKDNGKPIFRIEYDDQAYTSSFVAKVDEVTGWTDDLTIAAEVEPYITSVMIKWDSCSHFNFVESLHMCGVQDFKKHLILIEWLYKSAFEVMGTPPQPDETW